jgi:hypothetical protein
MLNDDRQPIKPQRRHPDQQQPDGQYWATMCVWMRLA